MRTLKIALTVLALTTGLAACHTIGGAGEDVASVGRAVTNTAGLLIVAWGVIRGLCG